ncbi:MAG: hypothetical protein IPP46_06580 [Bacteroidetes bacterium]|nr:hypothetical protein [Bacteroidota bacterium]
MDSISHKVNLTSVAATDAISTLRKWFSKEQFTEVAFEKDSVTISTFSMAHLITFKLKRREHYQTFYKETGSGALLVFEVKVAGQQLQYDAYCPLLVFGFWNVKLAFKEKSSWFTSWRKEGFKVHERFQKFIAPMKAML